MLFGIVITTVTFVAACVLSVLLRPDPELLRPIDRQSCRPSSDLAPEGDCAVRGESRSAARGIEI